VTPYATGVVPYRLHAGPIGQNALDADMAVLRVTRRFSAPTLAAAALAVAIAGCGSGSPTRSGPETAGSEAQAHGAGPQAHGSSPQAHGSGLQAHPQAVEPAAGVQAAAMGDPAGTGVPAQAAVGNVNDHAPPLAQVKHELKQLNLCGGVTDSANATPVVKSATPGFTADPGTSQSEGQLPVLTSQLNALGKALGVTIYGISGYRTPAHSVAVGGFAHDPHTQGKAEDVGVNSLLRSSAAQISEAQLARFGLYRPFDPSDDPNNTEVNHIQLIPTGGPLSLAQSTATWDPDPTCG
jgi:Peptidase M15